MSPVTYIAGTAIRQGRLGRPPPSRSGPALQMAGDTRDNTRPSDPAPRASTGRGGQVGRHPDRGQ